MATLSVQEFKAQSIANMKSMLSAIEDGSIRLGVNNQFNGSILTNAIGHAETADFIKIYDRFNVAEYGNEKNRVSVMDIARSISSELDDAEATLNDFVNGQY